MSPISHPPRVRLNSENSLASPCYLSFVVLLLKVRRISLTPHFSVCQSAQQLSIVYHVTVSKRRQQRWKSHLTSSSFFLVMLGPPPSCDRSTICGLPPRFTLPDTLTDIKLSKVLPPCWDSPLKVLMTPFIWGVTSFEELSTPPRPLWHFLHFIVIALPLVRFLRDLSSLERRRTAELLLQVSAFGWKIVPGKHLLTQVLTCRWIRRMLWISVLKLVKFAASSWDLGFDSLIDP